MSKTKCYKKHKEGYIYKGVQMSKILQICINITVLNKKFIIIKKLYLTVIIASNSKDKITNCII